ncbi:Lipid phosphate phosphatase epsilon 2, chloroplastic [Porphyridium purpureum]|uniref:Lipid phosphate phosphatase epsilon 2, chloroplastic n=1 Tax=Porphyridium purpureum TaxID=35688 RepID=A0A5J4YYA9_PORPP|nr:Lipid phosphate phosphatase epsilon 2, chloroplastic [Porphyridium purpureum]|eukprot:POR5673..scf209_3
MAIASAFVFASSGLRRARQTRPDRTAARQLGAHWRCAQRVSLVRPRSGGCAMSSRREEGTEKAKRRTEWAADLTKWIVSFSVFGGIVYFHNAHALLLTCGAITGGMVGKALKAIINETRPEGSKLVDPGMPSSHALQLFYWASVMTITMFSTVSAEPSIVFRLAVSGALFVFAIVSASWRVAVGFHSAEQVVVGAACGSMHAFLWAYLVSRHLLPLADPIISPHPWLYVITISVLGFAAINTGSLWRLMIRRNARQE